MTFSLLVFWASCLKKLLEFPKQRSTVLIDLLMKILLFKQHNRCYHYRSLQQPRSRFILVKFHSLIISKLKIKLKEQLKWKLLIIFISGIHQKANYSERVEKDHKQNNQIQVFSNNCIIKKKTFMCVTFLLWLVILMNTPAIKICD